jgi:hypothetical protein
MTVFGPINVIRKKKLPTFASRIIIFNFFNFLLTKLQVAGNVELSLLQPLASVLKIGSFPGPTLT